MHLEPKWLRMMMMMMMVMIMIMMLIMTMICLFFAVCSIDVGPEHLWCGRWTLSHLEPTAPCIELSRQRLTAGYTWQRESGEQAAVLSMQDQCDT